MVRIRYTPSGAVLQTDWFTIGPNFIIRGQIDTETSYFSIIEFNTTVVYHNRARSLREAKHLLKKALVSAGVNFEGEIRSGK